MIPAVRNSRIVGGPESAHSHGGAAFAKCLFVGGKRMAIAHKLDSWGVGKAGQRRDGLDDESNAPAGVADVIYDADEHVGCGLLRDGGIPRERRQAKETVVAVRAVVEVAERGEDRSGFRLIVGPQLDHEDRGQE